MHDSSVSGQDEPYPALWLATETAKMTLSCPLGIIWDVSQENKIWLIPRASQSARRRGRLDVEPL